MGAIDLGQQQQQRQRAPLRRRLGEQPGQVALEDRPLERVVAGGVSDGRLLGALVFAGGVLLYRVAGKTLGDALSPFTEPRAGATLVKLFPAGPVGPGYIRDLRGPLRQIPFLPTGGVTLDNAPAFIAAGAWGLGIGSALVDGPLVAAGRFDELTRRAAGFIAAAAPARGAR